MGQWLKLALSLRLPAGWETGVGLQALLAQCSTRRSDMQQRACHHDRQMAPTIGVENGLQQTEDKAVGRVPGKCKL